MNNQTNDKLSKSLLKRHAVQNDLPVTNIYTDNSVVIANMQKTIDEQKALIEKMREAGKQFSHIIQMGSPSCQKRVVEQCRCTNCVSERFKALDLPSEKG